MTIKELKEQIEFLPDDLLVCVEKHTLIQEKYGTVTENVPVLANEIKLSKIWIENENKIIRMHSYQKDCVIIK